MWQRKLASAYWGSTLIILYFALNEVDDHSGTSWLLDYFAGTLALLSIYILPIMFVYGVAVSMTTEYAISRTRLNQRMKVLLIGVLHAVLGFLFGAAFFKSLTFGLIGGAAAMLFFILDRIFVQFRILRTPRARLAIIAGPVISVAVLMTFFYAITPPLPPYTANDAVQFATSGTGTTIELFPKQVGTVKLTIEGYEVERETSVVETGKEQYEVTFTERWTKADSTGQKSMIYLVTRGSLTAHGGSGESPPYRR